MLQILEKILDVLNSPWIRECHVSAIFLSCDPKLHRVNKSRDESGLVTENMYLYTCHNLVAINKKGFVFFLHKCRWRVLQPFIKHTGDDIDFSGGGLLSSPILAPSGLCAHVRFISLDGARRNYKRNDGISWPHFRAGHRSGWVRRRRRRPPLRRPARSRSFPFAKMRIRRTSWWELHCVQAVLIHVH